MSTSRARQAIPVIPRAPSKGPSAWQRFCGAVRGAVTRATVAVRKLATRAGVVLTEAGRKVKARMTRFARVVSVRRPWIMTRVGSWTKDTWRRVVHPFLRVRVVALGVATFVAGLAVAPAATIAVTAAAGAALVGLARAISVLEMMDRPAARVALVVIEWAAQVGRVLAYVTTVAVIVVFCAESVAFAVTEVLELALRYARVPYAVSIAALAFFVATGSWALVIVETAWLTVTRWPTVGAESRRRQAIPLDEVVNIVPGSSVPLATDAEVSDLAEVLAGVDKAVDGLGRPKTAKCEGCDRDDGGARFGAGKFSTLCSECFEYFTEDEMVGAAERGEVSPDDVLQAIALGVRVPGFVIIASGAKLRSSRVDLDIEDITVRSRERVLSGNDPTKIYWAETAWWFDGRSARRARRWHGFVGGRVASVIEYQHARNERGFYVLEPAHVEWQTRRGAAGPYRRLDTAQAFAADEISDFGIPNFLTWAESLAATSTRRAS